MSSRPNCFRGKLAKAKEENSEALTGVISKNSNLKEPVDSLQLREFDQRPALRVNGWWLSVLIQPAMVASCTLLEYVHDLLATTLCLYCVVGRGEMGVGLKTCYHMLH